MEKFPDKGILGHYQGKWPDIVLSWENSLIIGILGHYQGKLPDNQWLGSVKKIAW